MTDDGLEARRAWLDLRQAMRCQHRDKWDAEYQALLGERVMQTGTPSMAVHVNTLGHGRQTVILHVANPIHPRVDTIYERPDGQVGTMPGIPAWFPTPPQAPPGTAALAYVTVPANATSIHTSSIQGVAQ